MSMKHVVIGIDGGGTHTRVKVCDLTGQELSYVERGAASLHKDTKAVQNVQLAIADALQAADRSKEDVQALAAGIAGYDSPEDLKWVASLTDLPGLSCPKWHFNDAVAAHAGALMTRPGIIVISGTGSIILGVTESERQLRNYDFHHYAASAARFISYQAMFEVLAGNGDHSDDVLRHSMLTHWGAATMEELAEQSRQGFMDDRRERDKLFGLFAPNVTAAAMQGSSIAMLVCNRAVEQLKVGIELIGSAFTSEEVEVALIGSVINSPDVHQGICHILEHGNHKRYKVKEPSASPVDGSIFIALKKLGIPLQTTH